MLWWSVCVNLVDLKFVFLFFVWFKEGMDIIDKLGREYLIDRLYYFGIKWLVCNCFFFYINLVE